MTKSILPVLMIVAAAFIGGCYTTHVAPDTAARANARFEETERHPKRHIANADQKESMIRLWSDVPDYVFRLRREKDYKKTPRLISSVPPSYPLIPLLANIKATVLVSFVIDEKGAVEAARVLESSDSRFDQSAVEAVLKWKFLPAEFEDGPTKAFIAVPVQFDGKK